jgi:hypothetical protein
MPLTAVPTAEPSPALSAAAEPASPATAVPTERKVLFGTAEKAIEEIFTSEMGFFEKFNILRGSGFGVFSSLIASTNIPFLSKKSQNAFRTEFLREIRTNTTEARRKRENAFRSTVNEKLSTLTSLNNIELSDVIDIEKFNQLVNTPIGIGSGPIVDIEELTNSFPDGKNVDSMSDEEIWQVFSACAKGSYNAFIGDFMRSIGLYGESVTVVGSAGTEEVKPMTIEECEQGLNTGEGSPDPTVIIGAQFLRTLLKTTLAVNGGNYQDARETLAMLLRSYVGQACFASIGKSSKLEVEGLHIDIDNIGVDMGHITVSKNSFKVTHKLCAPEMSFYMHQVNRNKAISDGFTDESIFSLPSSDFGLHMTIDDLKFEYTSDSNSGFDRFGHRHIHPEITGDKVSFHRTDESGPTLSPP